MKYLGIVSIILSVGCFEPAKVVVGVEEGALTEEKCRHWKTIAKMAMRKPVKNWMRSRRVEVELLSLLNQMKKISTDPSELGKLGRCRHL